MDILNILIKWELQNIYSIIELAIRLFLTMPATVASAERSFSKLHIIKNYFNEVDKWTRKDGKFKSSFNRT